MLKNFLSNFRRESKEPVLYPSRRAIELYAAVSTGEEQIMMPEARIHKEGSLKVAVDLLLHEIVGKEKEGLYIFDIEPSSLTASEQEPLDSGFKRYDRITHINDNKVNKGKKIHELQGRHTTFTLVRDALPHELLKNSSPALHDEDHGKFFYRDTAGKFYQCQVRDLKDALSDNHLFVAIKTYQVNHVWVIDLTYAEMQFALYRLVVAMRKANELHMSMLAEESEADQESQAIQTDSTADVRKISNNNLQQNDHLKGTEQLKQPLKRTVSHVEHGPAPVETKKQKAVKALYYIIPIVIIAALIVTQQIVSSLRRNGITYLDPHDTSLFPLWQQTSSKFRFYVFNVNTSLPNRVNVEEFGPFTLNAISEKIDLNFTTTDDVSFNLNWTFIYDPKNSNNQILNINVTSYFYGQPKVLRISELLFNKELSLSSIFNTDCQITVSTGKNNPNTFNRVTSFNDQQLPNSSTITLADCWPRRKHQLSPIQVFLPEFSGGLLFDRIRSTKTDGTVTDNRLVADCFTKGVEERCTKELVVNNVCLQFNEVPLVVTFPHFYEADAKHLEAVTGFEPNSDTHGSYFEFDSKSNRPIKKVLRLQVNLLSSVVSEEEPMLIPLFWFEQVQEFL